MSDAEWQRQNEAHKAKRKEKWARALLGTPSESPVENRKKLGFIARLKWLFSIR